MADAVHQRWRWLPPTVPAAAPPPLPVGILPIPMPTRPLPLVSLPGRGANHRCCCGVRTSSAPWHAGNSHLILVEQLLSNHRADVQQRIAGAKQCSVHAGELAVWGAEFQCQGAGKPAEDSRLSSSRVKYSAQARGCMPQQGHGRGIVCVTSGLAQPGAAVKCLQMDCCICAPGPRHHLQHFLVWGGQTALQPPVLHPSHIGGHR